MSDTIKKNKLLKELNERLNSLKSMVSARFAIQYKNSSLIFNKLPDNLTMTFFRDIRKIKTLHDT